MLLVSVSQDSLYPDKHVSRQLQHNAKRR